MILPYHCLTFKTDHLMKPCQKNLARVKVLKEAKKHVGPLEVCVDCRGKMLITKPPKPYLQDWNPNPEVTTAPLFLKDVGKKEPEMRQLSPEKIKKTREAVQRMGERYKKTPKEEKTVQEVEVKVMPVNYGIEVPDLGARYCPTHPRVPQRQDSLGRFMGMCQECLVARGRKAGMENIQRGVTAPPVSIPLNLPRYSELKTWLEEQADQNERTLQKEIMMVLKQAWRQGT